MRRKFISLNIQFISHFVLSSIKKILVEINVIINDFKKNQPLLAFHVQTTFECYLYIRTHLCMYILYIFHKCVYYIIIILIFFFRATLMAYGGSQARGRIKAAASSLHHSHSNARSEPRLQPTLQLMAMLDI